MSHTRITQAAEAPQAHHNPLSPVEVIARAYLGLTGDDARVALREAIADALADLAEAERRTQQKDRLISRGYVRGALCNDTTKEA